MDEERSVKTEYKIIKRESLVLFGFTVTWILMFILRNLSFIFKAMSYILLYAYIAHILVRILFWLNRRRGVSPRGADF